MLTLDFFRMTFHNIQSLTAGKEYQFRVIAENFYGKSEPCEPTSTIQTEESESSKRKKHEGRETVENGLRQQKHEGRETVENSLRQKKHEGRGQ